MAQLPGGVDPRSFAVRRELRDILAQLVGRGCVRPSQFEECVERLRKERKLALRQVLLIFGEQRVADEVAALEILGRLARPEDGETLAAVANDPRATQAARVACALVLLGHDQAELIADEELSGIVLRWQARHVAGEPRLRHSLGELYRVAPREERARWIELQDEELDEMEGRAAVFEMLLEIEEDAELRGHALRALAREPHPAVRAALRRIEPRSPAESDAITGALAGLAAAADELTVPAGWSARVGFCDGSGTFALRFDCRPEGRRPRCSVFLLELDRGPREALALTGADVARYDGALDLGDGGEPAPLTMFALDVREALAILQASRRQAAHGRHPLPDDFAAASRLLDPLADLAPWPFEFPVLPAIPDALARSAELADLPGYAGWFYDSGDRFLDDLRLERLEAPDPGAPPSEDLIDRAIERLADRGEGALLARRLRHNAMVHSCAGELEFAAIALASASACATAQFARLPLVRRMAAESLHPGHYFFAPTPDTTNRDDLAEMMLFGRRPTRASVLALDLAWILTRATDVWLSRLPSSERPGSDQVHPAILALSRTAATWITRCLPLLRKQARCRSLGDLRPDLAARLRESLLAEGFPRPASDPDWRELLEKLVGASETLVFEVCLGRCSMRCPESPNEPGVDAVAGRSFPAGDEAEMEIRCWPGPLLHEPDPRQRHALATLVEGSRRRSRNRPYTCAVCGERRAGTTRARSVLLPHCGGPAAPVCLRCQRRYRKGGEFRSQVEDRLGRLIDPSSP